ncbi:MAG: 4Fe-4S dicluster domain-containing protein [Sphingomonadaceae bacterium]
MSVHVLHLAHEEQGGPDYSGPLASEQRDGPGYKVTPPETRAESVLTSGFRVEPGVAYGFFTDATVCIGCKACEAACKQWNQLPMDDLGLKGTSYDNTGELSATTWRHVAFVEEFPQEPGNGGRGSRVRGPAPPPRPPVSGRLPGRWLFMSDVCKHCEQAGCLEACPTGAIVRTEFQSVFIQQDVCNGCKYCVPSCPFGVITTADGLDNKAHKCTLCYDRLKAGLEPACAKACPTDSILFGPVEELRRIARRRVEELHARGMREAYLYGVPGSPGATGGIRGLNCFFLLTERPEAYNLPSAPELPSRRVIPASLTGAAAALVYGLVAILAIRATRREKR